MIVVAFSLYCYRLEHRPYGRVLVGIRDNELLTKYLGKPTTRMKLQIFTIGSVMMGVAGCFYAPTIMMINPSMLLPDISFVILISLIVGGREKVLGSIVGTFLVVFVMLNLIDLIDIPSGYRMLISSLQYVALGVVLVVFMIFKQEGIVKPDRMK